MKTVKTRWWMTIAMGVMLVTGALAGVTVSNVVATQRPGTKLVDIRYDVASTATNVVTVSVVVSNGATALNAVSVTGDIGPSVGTGTSKAIVWNAGADWAGHVGQDLDVHVVANDNVAPVVPADMALIPAGSFQMGDTFNEGDANERPVHWVYVSAFYMDKYEVTYAKWTNVYVWATNNGYSFDNAGLGKATNHPVHTVNWYDCVKWCNARSEKEGLTPCYYTDDALTTVYRTGVVNVQTNWVKWGVGGYRLPTEAEWEKAARGGVARKRFPWSDEDTIQHARANYKSSGTYGNYDTSATRGWHPTYATGDTPYTSPVGVFGASGYGLCDMAGNMWEWCWDWYDSGWYTNAWGTLNDTRGPESASNRLLRGGCWNILANTARCASRYGLFSPGVEIDYIGFRAVRAPGQ